MRTDQDLVGAVSTTLDTLFKTADDHKGLIPAILDVRTARMPEERPGEVAGHRDSGVSFRGANLLDDVSVLATARLLDAADVESYDREVGRYLDTFVAECLPTVTGLFPWGDHAYWDLDHWSLGSTYTADPSPDHIVHDQRLRAPAWLWIELADRDPDCVQRFADGLEWHWTDENRTTYSRHARVDDTERMPQDTDQRTCDFPRHAGTFIHDLAVAYTFNERPETLEQLERFQAYWWERRTDRGLVFYERRGHDDPSPQQTIALASGLIEAASVLDPVAPAVASMCRTQAATYVDGFMASIHDGARLWGSGYPNEVLAAQGLTCLQLYRSLGDDRLLAWAKGVGALYRGLPFPADRVIPAKDPGLVIGLFADLADLDEDSWLTPAMELARKVRAAYLDHAVPRAATTRDHYDTHLGTGTLLHAIARTGLVADGHDTEPLNVRHSPGYRRTEAHFF